MSFDIPLHIPDNSPESMAVELVMQEECLGPSEAVLSILRRAQTVVPVSNFVKKKSNAADKRRGVAKDLVETVSHEQRSATRPANLTVAEENPIFGAFADKPEFSAEIERIIRGRGKRYANFA